MSAQPPAGPPPPPPNPQPGFPGPPQSSGKATAALVLGLVGLFLCPLICSILAIVFGKQAMDEIDQNPGMTGRGSAKAGFILGIVGTSLSALGIIIILAGS